LQLLFRAFRRFHSYFAFAGFGVTEHVGPAVKPNVAVGALVRPFVGVDVVVLPVFVQRCEAFVGTNGALIRTLKFE
jgi:hypothetical protein